MLSNIARNVARAALPAAALVLLVGLAAPAGAAVVDPLPIGPNQFFNGVVNDATANATMSDAMREAGYTNKDSFERAFRRAYGCTPAEYRVA